MALRDRNTLKTFFQNGKKPNGSNFEDLIDSMINKMDDKWETLSGKNMLPTGGNDNTTIINKQYVNLTNPPPVDNTTILSVPADGQPHRIFSGLTGLKSFEIIAAGVGATGHNGLVYAIALSGVSNIYYIIKDAGVSFMGISFGTKITLQWTSETDGSYNLEITGIKMDAGSEIKIIAKPIWG